jgi:hypothetical protein
LPNFRLYRLDGAGKIATADWLAADDDAHAEQLARELNEPNTLEIWNRNRLVARIPPAASNA